MELISKTILKDLVYQVNGAAVEVHKVLGPGLLESVYQQCLERELILRKINFTSEQTVPLIYKGFNLETKLRCDLFVENVLVVELKSVADVPSIFEAQIFTTKAHR